MKPKLVNNYIIYNRSIKNRTNKMSIYINIIGVIILLSFFYYFYSIYIEREKIKIKIESF